MPRGVRGSRKKSDVSLAMHCNREGCDTWQKKNSDLLNGQWFVLNNDDTLDNPDLALHFCCKECLLFWSSGVSKDIEKVGP